MSFTLLTNALFLSKIKYTVYLWKRKVKTMKNSEKTMDKIVALCKGRGFIYPGSEIYGGLANTWDYGPLGVEFKNNVKKLGGRSLFRNHHTTLVLTVLFL